MVLGQLRQDFVLTSMSAMAFIYTTPLVLRRASSPCTFTRLTTLPSTFPAAPAHSAPGFRRAQATMAAVGVPARQVPSPLPQLYVYDHCPFCVRVRHVLGFKNVKYNLVWLLNDDVATPTGLIGKKLVPIFQAGGAGSAAIGESLDICTMVDSDPRFGAVGAVGPPTDRTDIPELLKTLSAPMRRLTRPRFCAAPLPEFTFAEARAAYVDNHPLKDPDSYEENVARSAEYIATIQTLLQPLADMIHSSEAISEGGFSYDDVSSFPPLRSLTIIKGLELPKRIRDYVEYQAARAEIPLYDHMAW